MKTNEGGRKWNRVKANDERTSSKHAPTKGGSELKLEKQPCQN